MLVPEKKITEYITKLEALLKRFQKGRMSWFLKTEDEAKYRQILLEMHDLLGQIFGPGDFYASNLARVANEGIGNFTRGPTYSGVQSVIAVLRAAVTKLQQQPEVTEANAIEVLRVLSAPPQEPGRRVELSGPELAAAIGLETNQVNEAVALLIESGLAEWRKALGTEPYDFQTVAITSRGRYEFQRLAPASATPSAGEISRQIHSTLRPPSPIGSPYGFTDEDWELVAARRADAGRVYVVLGHQFTSSHFDTLQLKTNIQAMFAAALAEYASKPDALPVVLEFQALSAGYGEHQFNQIARDIIGSDIAVFDTSDLNPNVMLELGVALTWGVRVLPIKREGCPKPPSDVSGQTWADYNDSGGRFVDPEHCAKLIRMLERAIRKKSSRGSVT